MKICFIHNLYKRPYVRGGAEQLIVRLAGAAQGLGHEAMVIATTPETGSRSEQDGVEVYTVNSEYYDLGKKNTVTRLWWHLKHRQDRKIKSQVESILKENKPDLII